MRQVESAEPAKPARGKRAAKICLRIIAIMVITYGFGWALNKSATAQNVEAAGFGRGMMHGAMMPGAMPTLLLGRDVVIYAPENNGRLYKLGYTMGVNACGAFFFGTIYWRLSRWRKQYDSGD